MEEPFSWDRFDRISKALQGFGYLAVIFGTVLGLALLIFGSSMVRMTGVAVLVGSILIAAYHFSFSLLMDAVHDIGRHLDTVERKQTETGH
jgi:hypothetical protein